MSEPAHRPAIARSRMTQAEARRLVIVIESLPRFRVDGIERHDGAASAVIALTDLLTGERHTITCTKEWLQLIRWALQAPVRPSREETTMPLETPTATHTAMVSVGSDGPATGDDRVVRLPDAFDWQEWREGLGRALVQVHADLEALRLLRGQIDERLAQLADAGRRLRRAALVAPAEPAAPAAPPLPDAPGHRAWPPQALPAPLAPQNGPAVPSPAAADPQDVATWAGLSPRARCRLWAASHGGEVLIQEMAAAVVTAGLTDDGRAAGDSISGALGYAARYGGEFVRVRRGHYRLVIPPAPLAQQSASGQAGMETEEGDEYHDAPASA